MRTKDHELKEKLALAADMPGTSVKVCLGIAKELIGPERHPQI